MDEETKRQSQRYTHVERSEGWYKAVIRHTTAKCFCNCNQYIDNCPGSVNSVTVIKHRHWGHAMTPVVTVLWS